MLQVANIYAAANAALKFRLIRLSPLQVNHISPPPNPHRQYEARRNTFVPHPIIPNPLPNIRDYFQRQHRIDLVPKTPKQESELFREANFSGILIFRQRRPGNSVFEDWDEDEKRLWLTRKAF